MEKITFKKTMLFAMSCMMLLTNNLFSQTQNYFGTSGTFNASVWNTNPAGPYTSALNTTNGAVINFGNAATTGVTGASITVAGINVTQNVTINTIGGTISNYNNGVITINVSDNMTFDASTQVFSGSGTAGYIKSGGGVLAMAGNTYGGGFTLNAGTLIARGVNAMGANATTNVLTINGGTIAPITSAKDFSSKFSNIIIGGDFTLGATTGLATSAAALTFNTNTSLGNSTRKITIGGTGIYTWGGVISGDAGVGLTVDATAAGFLKLSGVNTYTGTTTINTGTLRLGSSSALGTVDGSTVINSTSSSSGGILDLAGYNYTTAEPLTVNGNGSGGGAIINSTSAVDGTFAGPITLGSATVIAGGAGKINLTNTIGGTGSLTIGGGTGGVVSGIMSMTGSLVVAGNWSISGANSYTGSTTVGNTRILLIGASGVIPDASQVILQGGTLQTGATTGFSETAGTLQLSTNNSAIALGTGVHTLTFADSHLVTWTAAKTLTITGWTGTAGSSGTNGRIFIGNSGSGLTSTQLAQISFSGYAAGAQILTTGEIVPLQTSITSAVNSSTLGLTSSTNLSVASDVTLAIDNSSSLNSITLAPGAKLTLNSGKTLTATNGITLQSDATGTATILNSGTYTGTITAEQYLGSARNWYVSSPVTNATSPATNVEYYYEYVEAGDNNPTGQLGSSTVYWKGLANGTTMEVGKGYIAKTTAGTTVQFSGTPNNGDITTAFNLTRNDSKGKGFNLVGNPYPSYLDWVDVAAANSNLDNTYYYRTKNSASGYTFVTWNGAGSNYVVSNGSLPVNTTVTPYIPPTQAFWVRVKSGTSSTAMNFTNTMREHRDDNGNLMKTRKEETRTSVRLQLQNGTETDELLIYQDEAASNSYDAYDSPKMMNNSSTVPDLYSKVGDERLVINGLNSLTDNTELPLGFSLNAAASLKLKATEMSNFPLGTRIYLLDKMESSQVELLPETEYSFKTTEATTNNEGRFSLIFRAPGNTTGIDKTENGCVQVFVNSANKITIIAPEKSNYAIYNALGQLSAQGTINHLPFSINHSKGVYMVKVNNQSTRVIVK